MASNSLGEDAPHMGPGGRQRDHSAPDAAGSTRQDRPASRSHWRTEWLQGSPAEPCAPLETPGNPSDAARLERFKVWANANCGCSF